MGACLSVPTYTLHVMSGLSTCGQCVGLLPDHFLDLHEEVFVSVVNLRIESV